MQSILNRIKNIRKEQIAILFLTGLLLLVITVPTETKEEKINEMQISGEFSKSSEQSTSTNRASCVVEYEKQLEQILQNVSGIGKVRVMLTLQSTGKRIIERDHETSFQTDSLQEGDSRKYSNQGSSKETIIMQKDSKGNEIPYITEELEPQVSGVLVIAQGGDQPKIKADITEAVMALFGVPAHKIKVMKME